MAVLFHRSRIIQVRKAKYFARMHKLRGYRAWLKQIIEERIRIEETVLTEVKQELRKESR